MSSILRSLIVRVGADTTKAQSEFKKLASQMKKQGREIANAGKTLTMGLTLPIIGAAAAAVKFASDMEESTNKVNVAFKDNAKQVKKWSEQTLTSIGIAQGTALDMAATFGDMGTAMGQTTDEAADMSINLVNLAGDLASFKNIGIEQASDALRGIYTGEGEALKTLGIIMQESTLIAYAQAEGYAKSYKEMSQAEKVALRYKYVMSVTNNAQGDFARTSDGVANQMRMVKESLKQAAASMGTVLLPMVAKVLKEVNKWLTLFQGLNDSQKKTIVTIGLMVAAIGPAVTIIGKLKIAISSVMTAVNLFATTLKSGQGLIAALGGLLGPAGVVILVVAALALLAAAFMDVYANSKEASTAAKDFSKSMQDSNDAFIANTDEIARNAAIAGELTTKLYDLADKENKTNAEKAEMVSLVQQINELMPDMNLEIDKQTGLINLNREAVAKYIRERKKELELKANDERIVELYKERSIAQEKAKEAALAHAEAIKKLNEYQAQEIKNSFKLEKLKQIVKDTAKAFEIYDGDATKANKAILELIDSSTELTLETMKAEEEQYTIAQTLGFVAKSADEAKLSTEEMAAQTKERLGTLRQSWLDYAEQVKLTTADYLQAMGDLGDDGIQKTELTADQIKKNLDKQIEDFKEWRRQIQLLSSKIPQDILDELEDLGPEFAPIIEELNGMTEKELDAWIATWREKTGLARDAAIEKMGPLPSKMRLIGRASGQGFIDGMNEKLEELEATATTFGSVVTKRLENVLEIASPSKVMKKIGKFTGMGFVGGILDTVKNVKNAALTMADATNVLGASPFKSSAVNASAGGTTNNTSGMYTLNVNGSTDPNMVAGIVVQKLRMAGAV